MPLTGEVAAYCTTCNVFLRTLESCPYLSTKEDNAALVAVLSFFLDFAFVILSVIPYVLGAVIIVAAIWKRRLYYISQGLIVASQWILCAIFKRMVQQQRPPGSCSSLKSYGMPSQHAAFTVCLVVWYLVCRRGGLKSPEGFETWENYLIIISPFILLSRIILNYHTLAQILAGSFVGGCVSYIFYHKYGRGFGTSDTKNWVERLAVTTD